MFSRMFDAFFGCWHNRYSFPMTARRGASRNRAASVTGTYVVCLDCGKEMPYDWTEMKVVTPEAAARGQVAALATKEAA